MDIQTFMDSVEVQVNLANEKLAAEALRLRGIRAMLENLNKESQ